MKSIALWYELDSEIEQKQPNDEQEAELHFNLWKIPKGKGIGNNFKRFLDIGIKIKNPFTISEIYLFLPQSDLNNKNKNLSISDLGDTITKNRDLLNIVFNDFLSCSWNGKDPLYEINRVSEKNEDKFYIYPIDVNRNIDIIEDKSGLGAIIHIKMPNKELREKGSIYIRFRININDQQFSAIENLSPSFLESSFFQAEIIDFRLNDIRDLDQKFLEENQLNKLDSFFILNKIHFFFMCNSKEENIYSNTIQNNCRILEWDKWYDYLPPNISNIKSKILAYHWKPKIKEEKKITDFSILIKTKFSSPNKFHIVYYIWGAIIIGCSINLFYNLIFDSIRWSSFNMFWFSFLLGAVPLVLFFFEILKIIIKTTKYTIIISKKFVNYIRH